jgi:hypothetical protein
MNMEEKINIAKILKDKPEGTKLWTDMFGEVTLYVVTNTCDAFQVKHHNKEPWFDKDGKLCKEGVLCIYPSKSMRDWEKFAWKKGDVLAGAFGASCIFDKWANDDYTRFDAKFVTPKSRGTTFEVEDWCKITNEACIRQYIRDIEEDNGGKLNLTTLEIENNQPEFKDGDIVCISGMGYLAYGIVKSIDNSSKKLEYYALNDMSTLKTDDWLSFEDKQIQPITETQQIILFDALAKEGKAWDADKKMIVNLKTKVEFKPFDKVLVRNTDTEEWFPGFFEKMDSTWNYPYHIMNRRSMTDFAFKQCIPYEGNEHLLGTTKDVEG